jgi:L-threonylcarbamoyladenylate synthase
VRRSVATDYFIVDPQNPQPPYIEKAGEIIRAGGLVAFPTETVYGLGANALDPQAIQAIFLAKGRPLDNPLIVHIADWGSLEQLTLVNNDNELNLLVRRLGERFWPGPLTLVLPKHPQVPQEVTAGLETVAIRWPDHPISEALIKAAGVPIAAPSANRSGRPSPTDAGHVMEDLAGKVELILDAGMVGVGLESTVLDLTQAPPTILRPGGVTAEQLRELLPDLRVLGAAACSAGGESESGQIEAEPASPSPGVRHAHYAPAMPLLLVEGAPAAVVEQIQKLITELQAQGTKVGVLSSQENADCYKQSANPPEYLQVLGSQQDLEDTALYLFKCLRECDLADVDVILVEGFPETGLGLAIMDRLRRACGGRIMRV